LTPDATSTADTAAAPSELTADRTASPNDRDLRIAAHLPFPIIDSKVAPPVPRPGCVTRTALIERLGAERDVPIIAVVAPAGYGKTTLLRQWAERDPRPFTWLTLDAHDNDLGVLLTYLTAALDHVVDVDPAVFRSLSAPRNEPSTVTARVLQVFRQRSQPAVLVLEDLHVLDDEGCMEVIAELVDRVPSGWQVVVSSRGPVHAPVARLRAEARIAELGVRDLAMDDDEAAELLRSAGVDLRPSAVAALNQQVEGWPAALYLAGLAIAAEPGLDPTSDAALGLERLVTEYVRSEVLSRLSEEDVEFLTRTAVLDRLSGPLCDAVLRTTGSARRLDSLERANKLVVPLDHRGTWYRCHHVLQDLLHAELERREHHHVPTLRRRAADWYEANDMPELAIEQAMALGDAARVAAIATTWGQAYYQRGRAMTARRWFDWVGDHLPIQTQPDLAATGALMHMVDGRPAAAERWLDAAQRGMSGHSPPPLRGQVAMLQALMCRDGLEATLRDAEQAATLVPVGDPYRGLSLLVLGIACLLAEQPERADAVLADAVEVAEDGGATPAAAIARAERALLALRDGRADDARALAERACAQVDEAGLDGYAISALISAAAARVRLEQGDVHLVRDALVQAQRLQAHLSHSLPFYAVQTRLEIARCYLALTDVSGARAVLREAVKVVRRRPRLGGLVDEITALQQQLDSLRANMAGASSLSAAELRLLPMLATHLSFREIGQRLFISHNTVKTEAISIYRKLGVSCRSEAIDRARQLALLAD
jgi:LuxR family maltose regulon positive regulatory protein